MTTDTERFIRDLAANVEPVRVLPRPATRAAVWLGLSLPYLLFVVFLLRPADGLGSKFSDHPFVIEQLAAFATGVTAAVAAFATTAPGYNRAFVLAPLVPLAIWMGDLGQACLRDVRTLGSHGWSIAGHWACFPVTVLVGALPAVVMAVMLRRGAPLTPRLTTWLGALAVAGLANVGVRFVHAFDTSVIVLAWHVGAVFGVSALADLGGAPLPTMADRNLSGASHEYLTRDGTSQHDS